MKKGFEEDCPCGAKIIVGTSYSSGDGVDNFLNNWREDHKGHTGEIKPDSPEMQEYIANWHLEHDDKEPGK